MKTIGKLNIVTTPIGNYADITLRAIDSLRNCDYIVCEEIKTAKQLLGFFQIQKELKELNEHNQNQATQEVLHDLINGCSISLISDCGTPAFADPGIPLIRQANEYGVKVDFVHGANSVFAALSICGFDISRFRFIGFLSPKKDKRRQQLYKLKTISETFVILDTPYRLPNVLSDISEHFPRRRVFFALDITTQKEQFFRGSIETVTTQIKEYFGESKIAAEFVCIVEKFRS
ncbi:MAG: 16S rRNA (cytidine(1402)-2'-O)-methyltransferase [Ignavibacteria bacterium]